MDISRLSPAAQKQILDKLRAQQGLGAAATPVAGSKHGASAEQVRSKYGAKKAQRTTESGAVITFDSQKEARRYDELLLMQQAGQIRGLRLQPQYTLQESYVTPEGERIRAIRYVADFSYQELRRGAGGVNESWHRVVEDVKSTATRTREYEIKRKMLAALHGIRIREV